MSKSAISSIKLCRFSPEMEEGLIEVLNQHHIKVERHEHCLILHFPEGTTREEEGFYRVRHMRYLITLPDGFTLHEEQPRTGDVSLLSFPLDEVPEEIRKKHPRGIHYRYD